MKQTVLLSVLSWALIACEPLPGEDPDPGVFYYPVGLELSESGRYAYLLNSNFDQRFNTGWLSVVDLEAAVGAGEVSSKDVVVLVAAGGSRDLRVPNLGGALELSSDGQRLYASHRSDRLISVIEVGGETDLSCGDADDGAGLSTALSRTDCDQGHLFEITFDAVQARSETDFQQIVDRSESIEQIELIADPFALLEIDAVAEEGASAAPVLLVGHLADSARSLVTALAVDPSAPTNLSIIRSDRIVNAALSAVDIVAVPQVAEPYVAVVGEAVSGGNRRSLIAHVDVNRWLQRMPRATERIVPGSITGGETLAGFAFSPDGARGYGADRINSRGTTVSPRGALLSFDTSLESVETLDEAGQPIYVDYPSYRVEGGSPLRGQPSSVLYLERPEGDLVAAIDLDQDAIYFVDPSVPDAPIVGRIDVPGGPFVAKATVLDGRTYIVASLFYDHGVALVDVGGVTPADFFVSAIVRDDGLPRGERAR